MTNKNKATETKTAIGVYRVSTLIAVIEAEPAAAWRAAVAYVRGMAHADGVQGGAGWYRTTNRVGYERGIFRCIPIFAMR